MNRSVSTRATWLVMIMLGALIAATTASAGPRDHVDGFFLRLSTGFGAGNTSISNLGMMTPDGQPVDKFEFSGAATDINIAIGGIIAPNLALHGTLFGWIASDPDFKIDGAKIEKLSGDIMATGFGVGLTYYFMPANIYLSASGGPGSFEIDGRLRELGTDLNGETDTGVFLDFTIGKEWWVGDKWGLGVAGGLQYHSFGDSDINENWSGTSYTIRFTATMN